MPDPLPSRESSSTVVRPEVLSEIASAIQSLRYGAVEITVHEGRVVQIERREKIRFGQEPKARA